MDRPPRNLDADARLRREVAALLRGRQAHLDAEAALAGIPSDRVNDRVDGFPHSLWDLVEHLRFTQADILEFTTRADYAEKAWPDAYWPDEDAAPGEFDAARASFLHDLDALVALAEDADLFSELAWAPGYTPLRELLLAADHNAHHLGQVIALRRQLGLWPPDDRAA